MSNINLFTESFIGTLAETVKIVHNAAQYELKNAVQVSWKFAPDDTGTAATLVL